MNNRLRGYTDGICKNVLKDEGLQLVTTKDGREGITTDKGSFVAYLPKDEHPSVLTTASRIIRAADAFDPAVFVEVAKTLNPYLDEEKVGAVGPKYKERLEKAANKLVEELGLMRDEMAMSLDRPVAEWLREAVPYAENYLFEELKDMTFSDLERNFKFGTFSNDLGGALVAKEFISRAEKVPESNFILSECTNLAKTWLQDQDALKVLADKNMALVSSAHSNPALSFFGGSVPDKIVLPIDNSATLAEKIVRAADAFDPFVFACRSQMANKDQAMQIADIINADLHEAADILANKYEIERDSRMMSMEAPIIFWFPDAYPEMDIPDDISPNVTFKSIKEGGNIAEQIKTDDRNLESMIEMSIITRTNHEDVFQNIPVDDIKKQHNQAVAKAGKEREYVRA